MNTLSRSVYFDPRGRVNDAQYRLAPRLAELDGARLGVLDNSKWNAGKLLRGASQKFNEKNRFTASTYYNTHYSIDSDPDLLKKIAEECDVVVTAIADCGSCTSCLIRDSVALERLGVCVAVIVTIEFKREAELTLEILGMPSLKPVLIQHPVSSIAPHEIAARVDQICEQAPKIWLGNN